MIKDNYTLHTGDCRQVLATLPDHSIDAVVCDPPYERQQTILGWDGQGVAFDSILWAECLRVLKPGGHLVAFGHSKTYHHLVAALERGGFEYRDMLLWQRQASFPVSTHVSKKFDGVLGNQSKSFAVHSGQHESVKHKHTPVSDEAKTWHGWGTALRNCTEPLALCRKPLEKLVRRAIPDRPGQRGGRKGEALIANIRKYGVGALNLQACAIDGQWPTNMVYASKAGSNDRGEGNDHPTVKPTDLMSYLCRMVTPEGGTVLDPFMGSGSTGKAALAEGFRFIGIEQNPEYVEISRRRIAG